MSPYYRNLLRSFAKYFVISLVVQPIVIILSFAFGLWWPIMPYYVGLAFVSLFLTESTANLLPHDDFIAVVIAFSLPVPLYSFLFSLMVVLYKAIRWSAR